jgi:glutamine cyclotransferase
MNGIAYDAAANKIYITGKNWPKLFEVKLDN